MDLGKTITADWAPSRRVILKQFFGLISEMLAAAWKMALKKLRA
jgi:hypothetical protein